MTRPIIPTLPPYPVRGEPREDFANKANDTVAAMPTVVTQMNAMSAWVDGVSDDCEAAQTAAEAAAAAAAGSANFVGEWSTLTGALAIPASVSHNDRVWVLTVSLADVTLKEPGVDPEWIEAFPQLDPIRLPENVTPASGATNVTDTVLEGKPFYSLYGVAHAASQWQVSATSNFSGALVVNTGDVAATNTYDIGPGILSLSTSYYWRHRYKDIEGTYSDWSVATQFTVAAGIIDRPTMTTPVWGATNILERARMIVDPFTTSPALIDTHLSTDWQVLRDSDGALIHESLNDTTNLLRYDVPAGLLAVSTMYRFRARFHGNTIANSLWREVKATTVATFGAGVYLTLTGDQSGPNTPRIRNYGINVDTYTALAAPANPDKNARGCRWSNSGEFFAVALELTPFVNIYQRNGDTLTKLANPAVLPAGAANSCCWSYDNKFLVVAHATSPYITIYQRSGTTFTKLANPATLPTGAARTVQFDKTDDHLYVAHDTSPFMTVYSISGTTFTKLANPGTLPGAYFATFADPLLAVYDDLIVLTQNASPFVAVYQRSGSTLTKIANPDVPPSEVSYSAVFSKSGEHLVMTQDNGFSNPVIIYAVSGTSITRLPDPIYVGGNVRTAAWCSDNDSNHVAFGLVNGTAFNAVPVYKLTGNTLAFLSSVSTGSNIASYGVSFFPQAVYGDA